jgi:putative hydrolase of HD superfamily
MRDTRWTQHRLVSEQDLTMRRSALSDQIAFLKEIDRLKSVVRQSPLLDRSRKENSAEHSWHLAMYALLLSEYAVAPIDSNRVIRMLLLHDIVEIDAGDTPIHGNHSSELQAELEMKAAARIFGLLPAAQGNELHALWCEFEEACSNDAKFAKALDRFQPLLVNVFTGGGTWSENAVPMEQVVARYGPAIKSGAPALWELCERWLAKHFSEASAPPSTID